MNRTPHIMVVDDDEQICSLLSKFLARYDYRVTTARDGKQMFRALEVSSIDLIILDLMLPGEDGFDLCRKIRSSSAVPIIMLTAMREDTDRIIGLELGADDYLGKPFNTRELLARVKAVLRRSTMRPRPAEESASGMLEFDGWKIDLAKRELRNPEGALVQLTGGEFDLLSAFADHAGRVLTRDQLLDIARGRATEVFDRSIDVQVSRLRRKIEADPKEPALIKTVRSGGYIFSATVTRL
ncbi:response regulator [Phenylobacterium sp.]|uniref:response regulator n=1 Tax=Phenylobacterium sp. TaxID=1871053 RepID=UPI002C99ACE4|nr:response regulator [Phenylobacterium sp.]HLZ74794.1 response regulator [Phenylobacterium sp.]